MSSALPSSVNIAGGLPSHSDLAPSIVFLVAYIPICALLLYRCVVPRHRTWTLLRPAIFIQIQMGFLVTRIVLAIQSPNISEGLTIANIVLVTVGIIALIFAPIAMWRSLVEPHIQKGGRKWPELIALGLDLMLIASAALGAYSGSIVGDLISNPTQSKLDTFNSMRKVAYALSLAVVIIIFILVIASHFMYKLEVKKTGYILLVDACVLIVSVFRIVSSESKDRSSPSRTKTAFWILQILVQWIAVLLILAISLPEWFPKAPKNTTANANHNNHDDKDTNTEMGYGSDTAMNEVDAFGKPVREEKRERRRYEGPVRKLIRVLRG